VFVSHASADVRWAEWIASVLEGAGYQVELDAWDWVAGDSFVQRMQEALTAAAVLLAVWSPAYFAGPFAMAELNARFAATVKDAGRRLMPVVVEACEVPELYGPLIRVDLAGLGRRAARERLLAAFTPARTRRGKIGFPGRRGPSVPTTPNGSGSGSGTRAEARFPALPAMTSIPARNPGFFGRDDVLTGLFDGLRAGGGPKARTRVLHGMPGLGKTSVALEYAHRYGPDYELV